MPFLIIKYLHVLGAIVLLGTGIGIAFFMLIAHRTGNVSHIARTATTVVLADILFTATAVVTQPVTGLILAHLSARPLTERWLLASLLLYFVAGMFWLPVVWIQIRMRNLARVADEIGDPLPAEYQKLFRLWLLFGLPGFGSVTTIVWLMIAKPSF